MDANNNAPADTAPGIERHYRVMEVARLLAVSRRTVNRMIEQRRIEAVDINPSPGGRPWWRIPESALTTFVDRARTRPRRDKVRVNSPVINQSNGGRDSDNRAESKPAPKYRRPKRLLI